MLKFNKFSNFFLKIILIFSSILLLLYYLIASNAGSKIILSCCCQLYNHINYCNLKIKIDPAKIHGNLLNGICLQNLTITQQSQKLNLQINNAELKFDLFKILFKKTFNLKIKNISGKLNQYPIQASLSLTIKSKKLSINDLNFIKIGKNCLYLTPKDNKTIDLQITLNQLFIFFPKLSGNITILGKISSNFEQLHANITSKDLKFNNLELYKLTNNPKNILTIIANLSSAPNIKFRVNWEDLTGFMHFCPSLTRLKGSLLGEVDLELTKNLPKITTDLKLKDLSASLPTYGIKIKPFNLQVSSKKNQTFNIIGEGTIRNTDKTFKLSGKIQPFNLELPSKLNLYGKNLEFINTEQYHLSGDFDLDFIFLWLQQTIKINGNVSINEGTINLIEQTSNFTKSKDVILIDSKQTNPITTNNDENFKILPDINLRIQEKTRLLNTQLDAVISGKMRVYGSNDHDNTTLAEGRITIKHGIYNLAGRKFTIEKGRIIYLPGTLLNNPLLDINVVPTKFGMDTQHKKEHLYIEGTINHPIIKDSGVFNEKEAMLHLLNFSNNKFNNIKKKFNLEEFDIQENTDLSTSEFEDLDEKKSLLDNKNFVISKKLFNNLYLRYLKPLNTPENKFKLNQKLNSNWAIELGSSTEDGYGADLKFYKESN